MITLSKYYEMLANHDWYWHFSDDSRVYDKGCEQERTLQAHATDSVEHAKLYEGFVNAKFSGKSFGKTEVSLPQKPSDDDNNK